MNRHKFELGQMPSELAFKFEHEHGSFCHFLVPESNQGNHHLFLLFYFYIYWKKIKDGSKHKGIVGNLRKDKNN